MAITWRNTGAQWTLVSVQRAVQDPTKLWLFIANVGNQCWEIRFFCSFFVFNVVESSNRRYVQKVVDLPSIHGHSNRDTDDHTSISACAILRQTHIQPPIFPEKTEIAVEMWLWGLPFLAGSCVPLEGLATKKGWPKLIIVASKFQRLLGCVKHCWFQQIIEELNS